MTINSLLNDKVFHLETSINSGSRYIKLKTTKLLSFKLPLSEQLLNPEKQKSSELIIPKLGRVKLKIVSRRNLKPMLWK